MHFCISHGREILKVYYMYLVGKVIIISLLDYLLYLISSHLISFHFINFTKCAAGAKVLKRNGWRDRILPALGLP